MYVTRDRFYCSRLVYYSSFRLQMYSCSNKGPLSKLQSKELSDANERLGCNDAKFSLDLEFIRVIPGVRCLFWVGLLMWSYETNQKENSKSKIIQFGFVKCHSSRNNDI